MMAAETPRVIDYYYYRVVRARLPFQLRIKFKDGGELTKQSFKSLIELKKVCPKARKG